MGIKNNSITRYIDPTYIANQARMQRAPAERKSGCKVAIVIVEGCADSFLYTTILNEQRCIIIPSCGKQQAQEVLRIFLRDKTPGVLVIVDDDFDSLEGKSLKSDFIVVLTLMIWKHFYLNLRLQIKFLQCFYYLKKGNF